MTYFDFRVSVSQSRVHNFYKFHQIELFYVFQLLRFTLVRMSLSSPEQKAQDELLWSLTVRCPSPTHMNDFSSDTPGPIFLKFHVAPSVKEDLKKNVQMVTVPWLINGKTLKIVLPNQKKLWDWILVFCIEDSKSTKFVQMMFLGWPFVRFSNLRPHTYVWEIVEKSFSQNLLKTNGRMIKEAKHFNYNQHFVPGGCVCVGEGGGGGYKHV